MIYQEDVIRVAHRVAGMSLAEADLLRRAMSGKLRSQQAMNQLRERFIAGCEQTAWIWPARWRSGARSPASPATASARRTAPASPRLSFQVA